MNENEKEYRLQLIGTIGLDIWLNANSEAHAEVLMNRNIKATYDGKHFQLTAEECNTVELLSFACDVVEQALHIVAGNDTELLDEAKEAIIEEIRGINEVHHERILQ